MASTDPIPAPGEPERAAWRQIAESLEEAIDTPELRAHDRGLIANLHDGIACYLGESPVALPRVEEAPEPSLHDLVAEALQINAELRASFARRSELTARPLQAEVLAADGIECLHIDVAVFELLRRAGLPRVVDVERCEREGTLRALRGIGPARHEQLRAALARYRNPPAGPTAAEREHQKRGWEQQREEIRRVRRVWTEMPKDRRDEVLLEVLGECGMTIRELTASVDAMLSPADNVGNCAVVFPSNIHTIVMRLLRAGRLERFEERSQGTKTRYRYWCAGRGAVANRSAA